MWTYHFSSTHVLTFKVTVVRWSPCRKYLASASCNGELFCWSITATSGKCVAKFQHINSKAITSLTWNKNKRNEVLFAAVEGDLGSCVFPVSIGGGGNDEIVDDIDMGEDISLDDFDDDLNPVKMRKSGTVPDDDDEDDDIIQPSSVKKKVCQNNN